MPTRTTKASLVAALMLVLVATLAGRASPAGATERVAIGSFWLDRTEVTIGAYRAFAETRATKSAAEQAGGGFEYGAGWERRPGWTWATPFGATGADAEPAVHLSWAEARDYCAHVGGRLPTLAEWTRAAYTEQRDRPSDGFEQGRIYPYPVGETASGMNTSSSRHVPVATTKQGVNGLFDMGANVWEWLADRRGDDALTAGGSWWYGAQKTTASGPQWKPADFYAVYVGFRCAYDRAN